MSKTKSPPAQTPKPKRRKAKKGRTRGALAAIGALLLTSALVRVGVGAGEAFAREDATGAEQMAEAEATAEDHSDDMQGDTHEMAEAPFASPDTVESELMPLIEALNAREARVRDRETRIDVRMQALSVAEQEIERKLVALEAAEKQLRATMSLAQTAAEDDLTQLTEVYANMKPKQAAALFAQMDPQFAAGFLGRMRSDSAAAILAGMQPEQAYLVSVILAGRNANVPNE